MDLSPDDENFQGRLLHQAALWDNVELLQELIANGADVDARDSRSRTALHAAALADRSRCLVALCAAGADVDARADDAAGGKTPLHIAAERGHVENIGALLSAGAELGALDRAGDSALALADKNKWRHAANKLREHRDALDRERMSQHSCLRELVSRGDVAQLKSKLAALGTNAGLIVNLTPGGANTLLFVASEAGYTSVVALLLEAGADGRAHPVTRYAPLYVASYHGHLEIAKMLLVHFPRAVQEETVEKWLPLHAACIGGHAALVTLLLEHNYPPDVLNTYTDPSGEHQYLAAFDVNARDAGGQSALWAACSLNKLPVVSALLAHTVTVCGQSSQCTEDSPAAPSGEVTSPQRGISLGIHAIVSKLTGSKQDPLSSPRRVRPVNADLVVSGDSCVARAVRHHNAKMLRALLLHGAKADAAAKLESTTESRRRRSKSASASRASSEDRETPWSALALACRTNQTALAEMLLAHGATDPHSAAAREACKRNNQDLLQKLLATKAYPDPDYKLNKSLISETVFSSRDGDASATYSGMCPSAAVMVTWRELRCQLATLRMSWLRSACLHVNKKLTSPQNALLALTRLDVSNNELRTLPPELFTLPSLRYLNAAQNKLERLPFSPESPTEEPRNKRGARALSYAVNNLTELYLQDNRLESLPRALFALPSLATLDVSNNKLRCLPAALWSSPSLKDLNAAFNHLRDLPTGDEDTETPLSPTAQSPQLSMISDHEAADSKTSSRSPSIEHSESEVLEDDDDAPILIANRSGNTVSSETKCLHAWKGELEPEQPVPVTPLGEACPLGAGSRLQTLNLAHNQFTCVPASLACRARALHRLNMAYNSLRSMSYVTSYPTSLRQLDLSHNEISCWPSLPQVESFSSPEDPLACFCPSKSVRPRPRSGGSVRAQLLGAACPARRHLRLEGLRTLILSNNLLTRIQLTTDDDDLSDAGEKQTHLEQEDEWGSPRHGARGRLVFPLLSMLDVSCNLLRAVPPAIHELSNLAVLNISGNKDITELPPQMGLLSRLWSLSAAGCHLHQPLRGMLRGGRCRSQELVSYLRGVLTEARSYSRLRLMLVGKQGIGKTSLLECLRQESAIQHRRKQTDHWSKRMGNKSSRRGNLSTVGVDIGTWVYDKQRSARGPVTFRTWDFGGQQEYYATHQYFLSRRSLYLVVWRASDGRKGLAAALHWLRSIQARAPGSPVIMVATHYDQVATANLPENESSEALQRLIRCSIMGAPDADKRGLPRVLDSVEVSCRTRHNIKLLADIIYSVAYSIKPPGSKEPLLQQLVPASYIALEECVTQLAQDLKEPVLRHEEYKTLVTQYMQQKNLKMFRDAAELHQATMFLHENGVLLHYDDATLKELYFVRPQWLCDLLAHVVTVREINPFAANGIMRTDDLAHVFKASPLLGGGEEAAGLGVALLNKFELALCWDAKLLLVPPLLPKHPPDKHQLELRSLRGPGARGTPRRAWPPAAPWASGALQRGAHAVIDAAPTEPPPISVTCRASVLPLRRILLLSYVPCGFWSRLTTRLLADTALPALATTLYTNTHEELDESISKSLELNWGWSLWGTGMRLSSGELALFTLRELSERGELCASVRYRVWSEGSWCTLDPLSWSCVELLVPASTAVLKRNDGEALNGYQSISLEPNPETLAKVLALVSDHVDLLLEDWYPSLGTRFVHTSEGRCLITRLVPCPLCLRDAEQRLEQEQAGNDDSENIMQELRQLELCVEVRRVRVSEDSRASDGDSGVGRESNASSRVGSVEGALPPPPCEEACPSVSAWPLEQCILAACTREALLCRAHPGLRQRDLAPDTLLLDVDEHKRAKWEDITRTSVAGRGAFGTVSAGVWRRGGGGTGGGRGRGVSAGGGREGGAVGVAVKALQPVPPPPGADVAAHQAYKAGVSRWEREPLSACCRAYCGLRQELAVLSALNHPHVVTLLGVCARPLALLLAIAPMGALDGVLRLYRGCGARVAPRAARGCALQLARALEYLHAHRVLYRDLKSENVLVWSMPKPSEAAAAELSPAPLDLHIKLGDYGISRLSLPSGTKGFGGTEGFMAPEIMRYNGEEEYNEKVDCFSFGMVLYEILSLRQPFEGHEAVKEAVLEGSRPPLTARELSYPCNMVETMRRCWSARPERRPSGAALVSVAGAPEWAALARCVPLGGASPLRGASPNGGATRAALAVSCAADHEEFPGGWEIWFSSGEQNRVESLVVSRDAVKQTHSLRLPELESGGVVITAMCRVGRCLWLGDSTGGVSVYSLSSCALLWRRRVQEAAGGQASPCAALVPLRRLGRVALALQCGRLFLVSSRKPEAEGSFVLTELGTATELHCLAAVATPQGFEVWAGGDGLHAYSVWAGGVTGAERIPGAPTLGKLVAGRQPLVVGSEQGGACIYQWSAVTREQTARLDCSKLAPCSESLNSLEEPSEHCQITALSACSGRVFAGTSGGVLVVLDGDTLRPLCVCRPYRAQLSVMVPLLPHAASPGAAMLATFGEHYRPLLTRFAPIPQITALSACSGRVFAGTSGGVLVVLDGDTLRPLCVCRPYRAQLSVMVPLLPHAASPGAAMLATFGEHYRPLLTRFAPIPQEKEYHSGIHCLLWRAHHWLPD